MQKNVFIVTRTLRTSASCSERRFFGKYFWQKCRI